MPSKNSGKKKPNTSKHNRPRDNNERKRIAESIAAFDRTLAEQAAANRKQDKSEDTGNKWLQGLTLFFVVLTTIGIFVQAIFFHQQVTVSRDTEERQLRAYIFVDKADAVLQGKTFTGNIELKNSGQTPAYDFTTVTRMFTEPVAGPWVSFPIGSAETARAIIGSDMTIKPKAELTVPADNNAVIPAVQNGTAIIYVRGHTEYLTAFGKTCRLDFMLRSVDFDGTRWVLGTTPDPHDNEEHCD